ncbi:hypothetical protein [Rhodanobacter hydrolyticus]
MQHQRTIRPRRQPRVIRDQDETDTHFARMGSSLFHSLLGQHDRPYFDFYLHALHWPDMKTTRPLTSVLACLLGTGVCAAGTNVALPANVSLYAKPSIGAGQNCLAGAQTDDDGMNEKPVVYLENSSGTATWHVTLPLPTHTYQARATHCVGTPSTLYVLVQGDTQPEQTMSQTLLEIVALNRSTGAVVTSIPIDAPNVSAAHTTWVDGGDQHFVLQDNRLIVTGKYALLSDRDSSVDFSLKAPMNLHP